MNSIRSTLCPSGLSLFLRFSTQALADEEKLDTYVQASTRFMGGQEAPQEGLSWEDLRHGREGLYQKRRKT